MPNKQRINEDFSKAAKSYESAAVVQQEICNRALERLQMLKLNPSVIMDIGSGTGFSISGLQEQFPNSHIIASDISQPMLLQARTNRLKNASVVCGDAEQLPVKEGSVDLIFSTSTFQWCVDLNRVFAECLRILKTDGVMVFSSFGPDTLKELRQSWSQVDAKNHVHRFIDMHHVGDLLLANQYIDPVVDMEVITIEYQHVRQLLQDLKDTGSRGKFSSDDDVSTGLMGKRKFRLFEAAYEKYRQNNGALPASYEVIYGYARKSSSTSSTEKADPLTNEVRIAVDQLK